MRQADQGLEKLAFQADAGDCEAQYRMGVLFLLGEAVEQDLRAAYLWLARAASAEHCGAQALVPKLALCLEVAPVREKSGGFAIVAERTAFVLTAAGRASVAAGISLRRAAVAFSESTARRLARCKSGGFAARRAEGFELPEVL